MVDGGKDSMNYFYRRRIRKHLDLLLKQARHVRNLREDIADPEDLLRLEASVGKARETIGAGDCERMKSAGEELDKRIMALVPKRPYPAIRDNIEILVVAIAVAMAFRTYFVQPFKIPTSSMCPTLYGIHYVPRATPGLLDGGFPLKLAKWVVTGQWYVEVRARTQGVARFVEKGPEEWVIMVNGLPHEIHNMYAHVGPGDRIFAGQLLASGLRTAGDHILVNKVSWNLRKPERGEIMVFKTKEIEHPQIKKNEHYVKRLVGLPGESLSIIEPYLEVNGRKVTQPASIVHMQERKNGYVGYRNAGTFLGGVGSRVDLGMDEYFACGDNQLSSLDSRYWGPVPRRNLVGPAFFVYWPCSQRWGLAD